jgi:hypothetical protein
MVHRTRKSKKAYEEYLNDLYFGQDISDNEQYAYMPKAKLLLRRGKLGTALRKHDPIQFGVGFGEWGGFR